MSTFNTIHNVRDARNKKGVVLLLMLIVMITLTSLVGAYLGFVQSSIKSTGAQIADSQIFYLADAGIHYGIYNLKQDPEWTGETNHPLGEGTFTVTLTDLGGNDYRLTSTGTADGQSRTVQQDINVSEDIPEAFYYVLHSGNNVLFDNSTDGTVAGDISAVNEVRGEGGMTINGTITEGSAVTIPDVNFADYQAIADYVISGNHTFGRNTTYNGIYYITGDVGFEDRVTLNGSIICPSADRNIDMRNSTRNTITAPTGYPAIVTAGNLLLRNAVRINITGLVYSQGRINLRYAERSTFTGTLICSNNINIRDTWRLNFNYDSNIQSHPPPYFSGGKITISPKTNTWREQ